MINNFGEKIEEARKRECDLMVNNLANITQVEKEKYTKKKDCIWSKEGMEALVALSLFRLEQKKRALRTGSLFYYLCLTKLLVPLNPCILLGLPFPTDSNEDFLFEYSLHPS